MAVTLGVLNKLKEFLNDGNISKQDVALFHKNISTMLNELYDQLILSFDKTILKDEYLAIFEELCIGKKINLSKALQILLVKMYSLIIKNGQGFTIRNLINTLINVCNNKLTTWQGKECAVDVLTLMMKSRLNDCASSVTDILQILLKLAKGNEIPIKISIMNCFAAMVSYENGKLSDIFMEIFKAAQRMTTERAADIRFHAFQLIHILMLNSRNFTTLTIEAVMPTLLKGLEDESAEVQDICALAIATIHEIQIRNYSEKQEQSKIGAARGSDNNSSTPSKNPPAATSLTSRISLTKLTSLKKIVVEEVLDFHTVIENHIMKNIWKSPISIALRTGYLFVLGNLIAAFVTTLSIDDLEWVTSSFLALLQDNSIQSLSYEDQNYFRYKLSFIFRNYFLCKLSEQQLINVLQELIKYTNGMNTTTLTPNATLASNAADNLGNINRSDLEILCCLNEMNHIVTILGMTGQTVSDEVITCATIQLRHSNFNIRLIASNMLASLSLLGPNYGNDILRTSLNNIQQQLKLLLSQVGSSSPVPASNNMNFAEDIEDAAAAGGGIEGNTPVLTTSRRKSIRENERLQRLYYFHGCSLTISLIIKNNSLIPNGLSLSLIKEIMKIGIEMISQDILSVPLNSRHIICSIIRAGGIILSSCVTLEYTLLKDSIVPILDGCKKIFQLAEASTSSPSFSAAQLPSSMSSLSSHGSESNLAQQQQQQQQQQQFQGANDEQIFEIMALESSLLCISSFLNSIILNTATTSSSASSLGGSNSGTSNDSKQTVIITSPQNTLNNSHLQYYLFNIIELLEYCFYHFKSKYGINFRSHYRYRNLYLTLLENFYLLPSGSYPNTSQQIYVESLRNFRDGITSGYECSANFLSSSLEFFYQNNHSYYVSGLTGNNNQHSSPVNGNNNIDNLMFKNFPLMIPFDSIIDNDKKLTWKLENYMISLSKKEFEIFTFMGNKEMNYSSLSSMSGGYPFLMIPDQEYQLIIANKLGNNSNNPSITSPSEAIASAMIDTRTMNIAIKLISITFQHQLSEYQDKAIQLFSQAIHQLVQLNTNPNNSTSSSRLTAAFTGSSSTITRGPLTSTSSSSLSVSSIFSSADEEKRKKEKKNYIILRNIIVGFHQIIKHFPIHSGKYFELDYQWRQLLIDNLYSLLIHSEVTIRYHAAQSLALFAIKWKGSNIISTICNRIRMSIMSIYEGKNKNSIPQDSSLLMMDFCGYAITLSHLWIFADQQLLTDVQSLALTTLYDCLKKVDSNLTFQAHVFNALNMISSYYIDSIVGLNNPTASSSSSSSSSNATSNNNLKKKSFSLNKENIENLIEKNLYFIELFFANAIAYNEEYLFLYQSLFRLITSSISLGLLTNTVSTNVLKIFYSLYKVLLDYFFSFILPNEFAEFDYDEDEEEDNNNQEGQGQEGHVFRNVERKDCTRRYLLKKHANSFITMILESIQLISAFDVIDRLFMDSLFTIFNHSLSKYLSIFNANNFFLYTLILKEWSENHSELFQQRQFFHKFYYIIEFVTMKTACILYDEKKNCNYYSHLGMEMILENISIENSFFPLQKSLELAISALHSWITKDITTNSNNHSYKNSRITFWILFHRSLINHAQLKTAKDLEKSKELEMLGGGGGNKNRDDDEDGGNDGFNDDPAIAAAAFQQNDPFGGNNNKKGGGKDKKGGEDHGLTFENISELLNYYREEIIYPALPSFPLSRYLVKFFALQMITSIFNDFIFYDENNYNTNNHSININDKDIVHSLQFHSNLANAREKLQQLLLLSPATTGTVAPSLIKGTDNNRRKFSVTELKSIPLSLSFFLNELMTLSCMMSTQTINDKNLFFIQVKGMHLLSRILHLFIHTIDPDALTSPNNTNNPHAIGDEIGMNNSSENKILTQSLSQILGSIRHCLNLPTYYTTMHAYAYDLILLLMKHSYLNDKIVLKRLMKNFITFQDDNLKSFDVLSSLKRIQTNEMNEFFSIQHYFQYYRIFLQYLQLSLLSNKNSAAILQDLLWEGKDSSQHWSNLETESNELSSTVITFLQETFQSYSSMILPYSHLLRIDTIRLLSHQLLKHSHLLSLSSKKDGKNENKRDEDEDGEGVDEFHPLRGGLTYSYAMNIYALQDQYIELNFKSMNYILESLILRQSSTNASTSTTTTTKSSKGSANKAGSGGLSIPEDQIPSFLNESFLLLSVYIKHSYMIVEQHTDTAAASKEGSTHRLLPMSPVFLYENNREYSVEQTLPLAIDALLLLLKYISTATTTSLINKEQWQECLFYFIKLIQIASNYIAAGCCFHLFQSSSSLRRKVYSILLLILSSSTDENTILKGIVEDSIGSLFELFFYLLRNFSFPQFFPNKNNDYQSNSFENLAELIDVNAISSLIPSISSSSITEVKESFVLLQVYQKFYSFHFLQITASDQLFQEKHAYLRRLYHLIGITLILMTSTASTTTGNNYQQLIRSQYFNFYEQIIVENHENQQQLFHSSFKWKQNELQFFLFFLWNAFQLLHINQQHPVTLPESQFIVLIDVILSLLQRVEDGIIVTDGLEESKKWKVIFTEILSAIFLRAESISSTAPTLFRSLLQMLCGFLQRQQQQLQQPLTTLTTSTHLDDLFIFQLIEAIFPVLLHSLLPVNNINTTNNNKNKVNNNTPFVTDFESRVATHKTIVLIFHTTIQFYNSNQSIIEENISNGKMITRGTLMEKYLSLSMPVYCLHINCYDQNTNTSTGFNSNNNNINKVEIQNYLVMIGKCLMNIISLISQEFRAYLISPNAGITEESKQLLQKVMKLSMTA